MRVTVTKNNEVGNFVPELMRTVSYRVVLLLSGAFILLMVLTIIQQIVSFVDTQRNPVSSIDVIENENGFHESAVILFSAFVVSAIKGDPINLDYRKFSVSKNCKCLNASMANSYEWKPCEKIIFFDDVTADSDALVFESPVDFKSLQTEALICDHPEDQIVVFMFIVVTKPFSYIRTLWNTMNTTAKSHFLDQQFSENIHHWVHCNFYTNLRLTKTEYYRQHSPDTIHIDVSSSTTKNIKNGQTRMNFAWRDGTITRIDKFNERSVWSFTMLLCAVLLGLERCYAIITRASNQRQKHSRKKATTNTNTDLKLATPANVQQV